MNINADNRSPIRRSGFIANTVSSSNGAPTDSTTTTPAIPFILVAEDDDNDAFGLELAFDQIGLPRRFRRVRDGEEVIAYLNGTDKFANRDAYPFPSVLLLDLKMPGMDGFDVLQRLREDPRWKHLTCVILTNSEADSDKERSYRLGANSYLLKPRSFKRYTEMLKLIERYWGLNQVPPFAETRAAPRKEAQKRDEAFRPPSEADDQCSISQ